MWRNFVIAIRLSSAKAPTTWIIQSNVSGFRPLYDNGLHGEGQVLGHMDGRVNSSHCSFRDTNPIGPTHRKILAYNTTSGYDLHGTHTACTAVGNQDPSVDNNTRGIAYEAKLCHNTTPSFSETAFTNNLQLHHDQGARATAFAAEGATAVAVGIVEWSGGEGSSYLSTDYVHVDVAARCPPPPGG